MSSKYIKSLRRELTKEYKKSFLEEEKFELDPEE